MLEIVQLPAVVDAAQTLPAAPAQAADDEQLVALWLHGRPASTQRVYAADAAHFVGTVGKRLRAVTLPDLQAYADAIAHQAPASRHRRLSAIKSLFAFAHRLGFVPFNVGAPLRLPAVKNGLAERILDEADVHRLVALEADPRNRLILTLLYAAGLRASELAGIKVRDVRKRGTAAQVTVFGKGGKTRAVLLSASTSKALLKAANGGEPDQPLFRSAKGGHLSACQIWRVVKAAAVRAGLDPAASTHWLRHSHVSHALDRGAPIHLVQSTVGHADMRTTGRYAHARPGDSSARFLTI